MKRQMKILKYTAAIFISAATFIILYAGVYALTLSAVPASPNVDTQASLSWTTVPNAKCYQIMRDDGTGAGFVQVAVINVNSSYNYTSYLDTGLTPETDYDYKVNAYDTTDTTGTLLQTSNTTTCVTGKMLQPSLISWKYDINVHTVTLTWTNNSLAAGGCEVRKTLGGSPVATSNTTGAAITFTYDGPDDSQQDYYIVSTDAGRQHFSPEAGPVTVISIDPPNITSVGYNEYQYGITWDQYPDIGFFRLERSKWNGSSWDTWQPVLLSLGETGVGYLTNAAGTYRYRLTATDSSNYIGSSNISDRMDIPGAPTNVTCTITSLNSILIAWINNPDNLTDLRVFRRTSNGSFNIIKTLDKSQTSYVDNVNIVQGTTYSYQIYATYSDNHYLTSPIASVLASTPAAPSGLTLTLLSSSSVRLDWTDTANNELSYTVQKKEGTGAFYTLNTQTLPAGTATFTDNSVQAGHTYTYRVFASNVLGDSTYSNETTVTAADSSVPDSLSVSVVSSTQVDLAWTYPSSGSYSTIIERKTGATGTWSVVATASPGQFKYSNFGLSPNTQYYYRVRNYLGTGVTSISCPNDNTGKLAITKLSSISLSGNATVGGAIYLYWSGNTGNSDVIVEKKMANGSFSAISTVNGSTSGWYDNGGLVPGATYTYRVKASTGVNESAYSNEASIFNVYLDPPTGLTVTANPSGGLDLAWKDNTRDESGYEVWRYITNSGSFSLYATLDKDSVKYTDTVIQPGVQFNYEVRAFMGDGAIYSAFSNQAAGGVGIISPPANLRYTYVSSTQVRLDWTDTSNNESGFRVEWKTWKDGTWSTLASLSANATSFTITGLNNYNTYYFRVCAYSYNTSVDSLSNEIEVSTAVPAAPSNVVASAATSTQADITWRDNSNNETGFRIMRTSDTMLIYVPVGEVGPGVTSYSDRGLYAGVKYRYKVEAFNNSGYSDSPEASVIPPVLKKVAFSDVPQSMAWAKDAIETLSGRGVIKGKTDKLFKPNDTITRGEFVVLLMRAFNLTTNPIGSFTDVKPGKWCYNEVMTAENLGIVGGDAAGRFYPDRAITREEMAVMIFKTLDAAGKPLPGYDNSVLEKFRDRNMISPEALSSLASIVGEGIMDGISGAIAPKKSTTRAEAAVVIYRIIDRQS